MAGDHDTASGRRIGTTALPLGHDPSIFSNFSVFNGRCDRKVMHDERCHDK